VSKFPVIQIPVPSDRDFETHPEGAIAKYWQDLPSLGRSLVKADLRGAWVEKITATLAERIGLPVAGCELVERADGLKMLASPTFLETGAIERAGESLLEDRYGINYPYTVDTILSTIAAENVIRPNNWNAPEPIATASDLVTGYLIFDSWIGNIDRHSKNWGIQQFLDGRKELLPTYDHGLSLGVRMPEDKLPIDLTDFSGDCRSSIQSEIGGTLTMNGLTDRLLELRPEAARFWIDRIKRIERDSIEATFDRLPEGWTSDMRLKFTIDLVVASRDRLIKLASERSSTTDEINTDPEELGRPSPGRQSS
jgi:hypothetical protein